MNSFLLNEHRCKCGKLLLKGMFFDGTLEIKCKKCGTINKIGVIKLEDDKTHYVLIINDHGIITNISDSACRILGYARDELIGQDFTRVNPTIPREVAKKFFGLKSALNKDNYFKLDTVHQSKDGGKIPVTALLKLYQPGDRYKYILLTAELKSTPVDKKITDKNNLHFLDNICDFYFEMDKKGVIEYTNPSVEKLFGISPTVIIGKKYFSYAPAKNRRRTRAVFQHFSANAQPYRLIHKIRADEDDKSVPCELYFTQKFDDLGRFIGYRVLGWVINCPNLKNKKIDNNKTP